MDIQVFMEIILQLSMLLWISIWISLDFYGYPCIDLLWILDPGLFRAMDDLRKFFLTLLDTELKRTDVISGWNPSLVGADRA